MLVDNRRSDQQQEQQKQQQHQQQQQQRLLDKTKYKTKIVNKSIPTIRSSNSIYSMSTISNSSLQEYDDHEMDTTELAKYMRQINNEIRHETMWRALNWDGWHLIPLNRRCVLCTSGAIKRAFAVSRVCALCVRVRARLCILS